MADSKDSTVPSFGWNSVNRTPSSVPIPSERKVSPITNFFMETSESNMVDATYMPAQSVSLGPQHFLSRAIQASQQLNNVINNPDIGNVPKPPSTDNYVTPQSSLESSPIEAGPLLQGNASQSTSMAAPVSTTNSTIRIPYTIIDNVRHYNDTGHDKTESGFWRMWSPLEALTRLHLAPQVFPKAHIVGRSAQVRGKTLNTPIRAILYLLIAAGGPISISSAVKVLVVFDDVYKNQSVRKALSTGDEFTRTKDGKAWTVLREGAQPRTKAPGGNRKTKVKNNETPESVGVKRKARKMEADSGSDSDDNYEVPSTETRLCRAGQRRKPRRKAKLPVSPPQTSSLPATLEGGTTDAPDQGNAQQRMAVQTIDRMNILYLMN